MTNEKQPVQLHIRFPARKDLQLPRTEDDIRRDLAQQLQEINARFEAWKTK